MCAGGIREEEEKRQRSAPRSSEQGFEGWIHPKFPGADGQCGLLHCLTEGLGSVLSLPRTTLWGGGGVSEPTAWKRVIGKGGESSQGQ